MEHRHVAHRASLVALAGGTIQIIYGLLAIRFPYPETPRPGLSCSGRSPASA